ncbi:DinB family protein [Curvibacter sp. CHRR-16]|uniref:DinB family protein n=1 Tax=Curvibacter sp. CHRR-16 TaxID=2835872 RepID=UPI001BD97880|nr:DinB family protein [Curvibacter sp. CHRR-16]MBT0571761.1 DinB family protein [Curvibacter sp. CHRR-16]
MTPILPSLFDYKAWADNDMMAVLCAPVDAAKQPAHHKAIRLMNHIHVVDKIFIAHLTGAQHGYTATNTPETPSPEQLSWDMADTAAWLKDYAGRISTDKLQEAVTFTFTDGDRGNMTRLEMLLHLHAHGTYHRGQVSQMLKDAGLTPPRELLTRMLHTQEPQRRTH